MIFVVFLSSADSGRAVPPRESVGVYHPLLRSRPAVLLQVDRQLALPSRGAFPESLFPDIPPSLALGSHRSLCDTSMEQVEIDVRR